MSLESFTNAYIEALLFSTNDEIRPDGGDPLDKNYGAEDFTPESMKQIQDECADFYSAHSHLFTEDNCMHRGCSVDEYAGHDFWLTRAHHGCGFWDGDWSKPIGKLLTAAAHAAGQRWPYVGDDGLLHYD